MALNQTPAAAGYWQRQTLVHRVTVRKLKLKRRLMSLYRCVLYSHGLYSYGLDWQRYMLTRCLDLKPSNELPMPLAVLWTGLYACAHAYKRVHGHEYRRVYRRVYRHAYRHVHRHMYRSVYRQVYRHVYRHVLHMCIS